MTRFWVELSRSQLVLRALIVVGPVVAVLASGPAGHWPPWWMLAVVLGLACGFAALPESAVGAGTLIVVLGWWTAALSDGLHPEVLVAAVALLVTHLAALLASYGPGAMSVPMPLVWLWVRRGAAVLVTVPPVWGLALLLRGDPEQPGIWVVGVAVALAVTIAAGVALTTGQAVPEES